MAEFSGNRKFSEARNHSHSASNTLVTNSILIMVDV